MEDLHPILQKFYMEIDPEIRSGYLSSYGQEGAAAEDPAAAYRQELFTARHVHPKKSSQPFDRFLWNLITMLALYRTPGLFPKRHKKEVLSTLRAMQLDARPLQDEACEEALYLEYRNAVRRYFSTCRSGAYGSRLFGMVASKEEDREQQRCIDTWSFSYGLAELTGVEQEPEMQLFCRAVNDEYCASVTNAASLKEAYAGYSRK